MELTKSKTPPVVKKAGQVSDEMIRRVVATAHGIHYDRHPRRTKLFTILKAAIPMAAVGILLGRKSVQRP